MLSRSEDTTPSARAGAARDTMDVLYDVANLGLGFGTPLTRTGIFRATEAYARAALASALLAPRFAALESYAAEIQLARFDRETGLLGERRLTGWAGGMEADAAIDLVERVLAADPETGEGRRLSAELRLANRMARARPLAGRFDVYHSLRQPLAARERVDARARAVTIHDMVPFLFPELTEERFVAQHRGILASIDPERDWVVCNSECTRRDFCGMTGMRPERVFVTPFAAAPEIFHPEPDAGRIAAVRGRLGIGDRPYVLSLCTLEPRKNLPRLVRAFFAAVAGGGPRDLLLVLVGPTGWKAEALFASLDERPAWRERVRLTGYVPDSDLSALYSGARVFAFPSLYEGFGLPALEAMQCGCR